MIARPMSVCYRNRAEVVRKFKLERYMHQSSIGLEVHEETKLADQPKLSMSLKSLKIEKKFKSAGKRGLDAIRKLFTKKARKRFGKRESIASIEFWEEDMTIVQA